MCDRARSANDLDSKKRIFVDVGCGRELSDDVFPVGIHLIREHHWQGSLHSLTKLETINLDYDLAVRSDVDECIRRINLGRLLWHPRFLS